MSAFGFSATLDAVEEVLDVAVAGTRAGSLRLGLPALVGVLDPPALLVDEQRPLVAVEGDAEAEPLGAVLRPHPVFPDEAGVGEFLGDDLGIGDLLVVVEDVLAAARDDGERGSTPSPQRATSTPWMPLLPSSPVPQFQNQCQL